jgi:hypothetical protein
MLSTCIVCGLQIAVNNENPMSVTTEVQEWVPFTLVPSYKVFLTAIRNIKVQWSSYKVPDNFVEF